MKIPILTHEGKKFMPHMYPLDLGPGVDITLLRALHGLDGLLLDMFAAFGNQLPKGVRLSLHKDKYKRVLMLAATKPVPDFALLFEHALNEQIRVCLETPRLSVERA